MNQQEWSDFFATQHEANFLQSWQWGELHKLLGNTVIRQGVYIDDALVGAWQGIVKDARRGRYLEVPGGPLINWSDDQQVGAIVEQLYQAAREHHCVFVRVRPQWQDSKEHRAILQSAGLQLAPMHLHAEHTNILNITRPPDELLAGMRRQTRYEVKKAAKQDVGVSWRSDQVAIDEFFQVQADTAVRQGFVPPSQAFLRAQQQAFGDDVRIYRAEKEGTLLNLALVVLSGEEADYHEAASTPESRSLPGAYAIQWQAIQDAKALGKTRYNFWGIAYSDDPNHRYAGVTTFKRGFGGDDVTYIPAHDLVVRKTAYIKNWLVETIRKKKRKL